MPRRTRTYTVRDPKSRDDGKEFQLTEMPAVQAERWAMRAVLALNKGGAEIPDEIAAQGMRGLLAAQDGRGMMGGIAGLLGGLLRGLHWEDAEPLLAEMMGCVQINESANVTRRLTADDIEEVTTLFALRREVLDLHTGFFTAAAPSKSPAPPVADPISPNT